MKAAEPAHTGSGLRDCLGSIDGNREADPELCSAPFDAIMVLMPMTSPCEFSSGPPELPGLMAASVWMASSIGAPSRSGLSEWN